MPKALILDGQKFGRLTVIGLHSHRGRGFGKKRLLKCVCDCGGEALVETASLRSGVTKSCGCLRRETFMKTRRNPEQNVYTIGDKKITTREICSTYGIKYRAFLSRLRRGWSLERAVGLTTK